MNQETKNDFKNILNAGLKDFRTYFEPGEEVEGIVSSISKKTIFLDINAKSEGIIDPEELEEDGELKVKVGDRIKAFFVKSGQGGELLFTVKIKSKSVDDEAILNAAKSNIPIEGRVEAERNGGFEVVIGANKAFCPYSQIDRISSEDKSIYIGSKFLFLILEYNDTNLVVSRRKYLESELEKNMAQLQETLEVGDTIDGTVSKIMEFGVFIDIGGMDGLIPMGELSWARVRDATEIVKVGEKVSVRILNIDWEKNRLTLSLKEVGGNPWGQIQDKYHVSKQYKGTVTNLMPFGAFVQLEPGIEGLVHISKLGAGKRINHASEVLKEGEVLQVFIESIDLEKRRIGLTLENVQQGRTMKVEGEKLTVAKEMMGNVEDIKPYGIFIKLTPQKNGLLHISEIPFEGQVNKFRDMIKRYPVGSEIGVLIKEIHQEKVSLALPSNENQEDGYRQYLSEKKENKGFGSLESAFDGLS